MLDAGTFTIHVSDDGIAPFRLFDIEVSDGRQFRDLTAGQLNQVGAELVAQGFAASPTQAGQ